MPYRSIPVDTKFRAVMDYFEGIRPADIERKHGVDRDSLRIWVRQAERAVRETLSSRPGRPPKERGDAERLDSMSRLSQNTTESMALEAPRKRVLGTCPVCGSTRISKNGRYLSGGQRVPLERVQRYICRDCKSNLYGSKKNSVDRKPNSELRTSKNRSV